MTVIKASVICSPSARVPPPPQQQQQQRCCVKFSAEFSERDLFRLACNACWEILECVEWGTVVQLSGRAQRKVTRRVDTASVPSIAVTICVVFHFISGNFYRVSWTSETRS